MSYKVVTNMMYLAGVTAIRFRSERTSMFVIYLMRDALTSPAQRNIAGVKKNQKKNDRDVKTLLSEFTSSIIHCTNCPAFSYFCRTRLSLFQNLLMFFSIK